MCFLICWLFKVLNSDFATVLAQELPFRLMLGSRLLDLQKRFQASLPYFNSPSLVQPECGVSALTEDRAYRYRGGPPTRAHDRLVISRYTVSSIIHARIC